MIDLIITITTIQQYNTTDIFTTFGKDPPNKYGKRSSYMIYLYYKYIKETHINLIYKVAEVILIIS